MKKVYAANDVQEAHEVKAYLEGKGITIALQGEHLNAVDVLGFTPQISPVTLWTVKDEEYEEACELARDYLGLDHLEEKKETSGDPWECPKCGESIEAQFDQCWSCEAFRS